MSEIPNISTQQQRYSLVAMILHWLIAAAIFGLVASGFWMTGAINVPETQNSAFEVYQIHKSFGLSVLGLVVVRILWRITNRPPAGLPGLSHLETTAALFGHMALYLLMLGVPLIGWALVSASVWGLPTIWFGQFEWPHIPWFADLEADAKGPVEEYLKSLHKIGAYSLLVLALGHVAAALKHQFLDGHPIFNRMLPTFKSPTHNASEESQQ